MNSCCVFCYEKLDQTFESSKVDLLLNFFKQLDRHLNVESYIKGHQKDKDAKVNGDSSQNQLNLVDLLLNAGMSACEECLDIIKYFCDLFHQMKSIELLISWKLSVLKDIMLSAENDLERRSTFRETVEILLEENMGADFMENDLASKEMLMSILCFKTSLISRCERKLSLSFPQLKIRKCQADLKVNALYSSDSSTHSNDTQSSMDTLKIESLNFPKIGNTTEITTPSVPISRKGSSASSTNTEKEIEPWDFDLRDAAVPSISIQDLIKPDASSKNKIPKPFISNGMGPFQCQYCSKWFRNHHSRTAHIRWNHLNSSVKEHECQICYKKFSSTTSLKHHLDSIHIDQSPKIQCDICQKSFKHKASVYLHKQAIHANLQYKCHYCPARFNYKHGGEMHIGSHHTNSNGIPFPIILDRVEKPIVLDRETKKMSKPEIKVDPSSLTEKGTYILPDMDHAEDTSGSVKCHQCGRHFKSKQSLRQHKRWRHRTLPKCQLCKQTFPNKLELESHIKAVHHGKRFACQICGNLFTYKHSLALHLKTNICSKRRQPKEVESGTLSFIVNTSLPNNSNFICNYCEKFFQKRQSLLLHMRWKHGHLLSKQFQCDVCKKMFAREATLKIHIETVHNGIRHQCENCNSTFSQKGSLKLHMKNSCSGIRYLPTINVKQNDTKNDIISELIGIDL